MVFQDGLLVDVDVVEKSEANFFPIAHLSPESLDQPRSSETHSAWHLSDPTQYSHNLHTFILSTYLMNGYDSL